MSLDEVQSICRVRGREEREGMLSTCSPLRPEEDEEETMVRVTQGT